MKKLTLKQMQNVKGGTIIKFKAGSDLADTVSDSDDNVDSNTEESNDPEWWEYIWIF